MRNLEILCDRCEKQVYEAGGVGRVSDEPLASVSIYFGVMTNIYMYPNDDKLELCQSCASEMKKRYYEMKKEFMELTED